MWSTVTARRTIDLVMADSDGRYLDPRVFFYDQELRRYAVSIAPVTRNGDGRWRPDVLQAGSGTCIRIAGRFFIATAAHVVLGFPETSYWVATPTTTTGGLTVIGGGRRGGRNGQALDAAWLELPSSAASAAGRYFLDIARLGPYRNDLGEPVRVYGFPIEHQERRANSAQAVGTTWTTRGLAEEDVAGVDRSRRLYLEWLRMVPGLNDQSYEQPDAHGLSGGGIWAINTRAHGEAWRPDQAQLIGIQFAVDRDQGHCHLIGQQIHVWLEMVAEDLPELAHTINAHLRGAQLLLT